MRVLAVLGAAGIFVWIAVATWQGAVTALWLGWGFLFLAFEVFTLRNKTPGDTLSGHAWRFLRRRRTARAVWLAALLTWLFYHFVFSGTMPH